MSGSHTDPGTHELSLLRALSEPSDREAIRFGERALDYRRLRGVTAHLASSTLLVW